MSSIVIDYLYRDAGNNKRHGQRVLANPTGIPPEAIWAAFQQAFRACQLFPDIVHFCPAALGWAALFFPDHDPDGDDIALHELVSIEGRSEQVQGGDGVGALLRQLAVLPADRGE